MSAPSNRYRLRKELAVIPMETGVQLRAGDDEIVVIESSDSKLLYQLLTECRIEIDRDRLIQQSGDAELVADLEEELHAAGLVELAIFESASVSSASVSSAGTDEGDIERYLNRFRQNPDVCKPTGSVIVATPESGPLSRILTQCLEAHELRAIPSAEATAGKDLNIPIICAWEQPHLSWIKKWNGRAIRESRPCLFVDLSHGRHATIGPFYFPDEAACYECFRQRLRENTASLSELDAAHQQMLDSGEPLPKVATLPAFQFQVAGIAVAELFASLSRHRQMETLNRAITVSFEEQTMWSEPVWRIPWCNACSD
jgi:bacteriocin biosynthesis cyclodehydratase domain-containing protein